MIKICEHCGKEFNTHHSNQKFCSTDCQHKAREITYTLKCSQCNKLFKTKQKNRKFCSQECYHQSLVDEIQTFCDYCGKPITITPSENKYYEHHFCNADCQGKYKTLTHSKVMKCDYCSKNIKVVNCIDDGGKHFCDANCYYNYKRTLNQNEYILHEDYAIIVVQSPKYGTFEVKIDLEDVEKCKKYYWLARNCKQGTVYFYAILPNKKWCIYIDIL